MNEPKVIRGRQELIRGMNISDGVENLYRNKDGSLTMGYLTRITDSIEARAKEFELALKQFFYSFPTEGNYKISWVIEDLGEDDE